MYVVAAGARSSIGESLRETRLSLAAGIRRFRRTPQPIGPFAALTYAPALEVDVEPAERARLLLDASLNDLWGGRTHPSKLGIVVLVDRLGPNVAPDSSSERLAAKVMWDDVERLDSVEAAVGTRFDTAVQMLVLPADASAAVNGLLLARDWLATGAVEVCLFGGLSVGCDFASMEWRANHQLLHGSGGDEGLIPGEAAAFVELRARGSGIHVEHMMYSQSTEPSGVDALTDAMNHVLDNLPGAPSAVWLDANGLVGRKREWALASARSLGLRKQTPLVREPLRGLGDVGPATLPMMLGLAFDGPRDEGPILGVVAHGFSFGRGCLAWEST